MDKQLWFDKLSNYLARFITSTFIVIIVMVSFMIGVSIHIADVFDSWSLAVGIQSVVLISAANSDILPKVKLFGKDVAMIPLIMSLFMLVYVFYSYGGLDSIYKWSEFGSRPFVEAISKAIGLAGIELIFATLFTTRWDRERKNILEGRVIDKPMEDVEEVKETKPPVMPVQPPQQLHKQIRK